MSPAGVILYGPPGAGKDTITRALCELDARYVPYQRLKAGNGRRDGYRMVTPEQLDALAAAGALLYRNRRYGAEYAIDRPELAALNDAGRLPIVHVGQIAGVLAVEGFQTTWTRVLLWCSRAATEQRCRNRGDQDVTARLEAWDATRTDLAGPSGLAWAAAINTDDTEPGAVARAIHATVATGLAPAITAGVVVEGLP